jgi:hypothetical protein
MKTRLALLLCLAVAALSRAGDPAAPVITTDRSLLTGGQLEQLLSPIALYPDALIAIILPAATAPADIVLAARYLKDNGDPAAVDSRSWDESVKSLVHYAEVVTWMDENLAWTKQVGEAFREQPAEVMEAIQRLRAKARAAGTLQNSPQQQVVADGGVIAIVPTQPSYLYVPYYDPRVVYSPRPDFFGPTTFITYSRPFAVGSWLRFDCDWRQRTVWTVDRHWAARDRHDWRHPVFPGQPGYVNDSNRHPWRPSTAPHRPVVTAPHRGDFARPAPVPVAPQLGFATTETAPRSENRSDYPSRPFNRNSDHPRNRPPGGAPVAVTPGFAPPLVSPTPPASTAPSYRRDDSGHNRNEAGGRPRRTGTFPTPPAMRPSPAHGMNVAPPAVAPSTFPFGPPPSTPIVPAFSGPVVPAMSGRPATSLPAFQPPPPAQTPPPPTTPDGLRPDDRRRGGYNEYKRQQLN